MNFCASPFLIYFSLGIFVTVHSAYEFLEQVILVSEFTYSNVMMNKWTVVLHHFSLAGV